MTKSTITREQLEEWVAQFDEDGGCDATDRQLEALIRQSLAAMDSEPVAFIFKHPAGRLFWSLTDESNKGHDDVMPVYAAPQPAMVAPVCTCPSGDGSLRWPCPVHPGNSPAQSDCCPAQNCIHSAQGVDRPVAWHHTAKSKEGNHGTCCFSYASSHDFGPRYEKPQSQPHYLPERLDYDRALHFLSTEPRKVTPETVIGGNSPVIPDGWTCNDKANAALMMLDRIETVDPVDDDRIDGIKRIVRELAAAPHDTPALNSVQSVDSVADRWIPVSEQMPEVGVKVLCFPVKDEPIHATFNGQLWLQDISWSGSDEPIDNVITASVTHWMPLPAAPQEPKP